MRNMLARLIANVVALYVVTQIIPGIHVDNNSFGPIIVALIALGVINTFIRPIVMFFAWPINCLTFGLLGFVINIFFFWLIGQVVPGFHVKTAVAAVLGSIVMGIISSLLNTFLKDRGDRDE